MGDFLLDRLSDKARVSFDTLCEHWDERDKRILGNLLVLLALPREIRLTSGKTIRTKPLDSGDTALGGISLPELRRIVNRAKRLDAELEKLAVEVSRLKRSPLVRQLAGEGLFDDDDILGGSDLLMVLQPLSTRLDGLLALPRIAREVITQKRPEYARQLTAIYKHIRNQTGQWHDALLADILNDLFPNAQNPHNEGSLKQWRFRLNLKDPSE